MSAFVKSRSLRLLAAMERKIREMILWHSATTRDADGCCLLKKSNMVNVISGVFCGKPKKLSLSSSRHARHTR